MLKIIAATGALFLAVNSGVALLGVEMFSPDAIAHEDSSHDVDIEQQLQGLWQFEQDGDTIYLIFTPDDEAIFLLPDRDGEEVFIAVQMTYNIDPTQSPIHLDLITDTDTALTIFEISNNGQELRINLDSTTETTRPEELKESDVVMTRVSDETEIPEDISVINLDTIANDTPSIPIQFITILLQGQQAYYQANNIFAEDVLELGFATLLETDEYFYRMQRDREGTSLVTIAAIPKTSELISYVGAVFAVETNGQRQTIAGICQSEEPVEELPIPQISEQNSGEIQCPSGASLIQ